MLRWLPGSRSSKLAIGTFISSIFFRKRTMLQITLLIWVIPFR
ncbi:hypothetical protein LINGRAHAP2_LOCUS35433 [Linum grandiflorum]